LCRCAQRLYRECAHLLLAVGELAQHFEPFRGIPKVDGLHAAIADIKKELRVQIFADVNRLSTGADKEKGDGGDVGDGGAASAQSLEQLADACAAVDALGEGVRREMLSWFCNLTLAPYRHIFHPYADGGSLERTEVRYTWHRQALKKYHGRYASVFPRQWHMAAVLTVEFCKVTRVHLSEILTEAGRSDKLQVGVLTHALVKTSDFEKEMAQLFGGQARRLATHDGHILAATADADAEDDDDDVEHAAQPAKSAGWSFIGSISSAFQAYMGTYVSLEERSAKEGVATVLAAEKWVVAEDLRSGPKETRVLKSSIELFLQIKRALKRCVPVSTGEVLVQLQGVWRAALCSYAVAILSKLPKLPGISTGWEPPAVHLTDEDLELVCAVVTTCEYCSQTSGELEETIRRQLDPELAPKADMAAAQDGFQGAISAAVRLLVSDVETALHPHLLAYTRVKWSEVEDVAEESPHMNAILRKLSKVCEFWGSHLLPIYVRFTCDKLVSAFMPRFVSMIHRCKRLGETGAQQVLLDLQALKGCLLDLPRACNATSTSVYTKMVGSELGKAEQLLRLVLTPEHALAEHFSELAAGLAGVDLAKVLELKGVRRPEMTTSSLLEELKGGVSSSAANASLSQGSLKIKKLLNMN